jgi:DNA-binding response OmpR family regulator
MRGPTILLVEDDAAIRDLLDHHLHRAGYQVVATGDGLSALRLGRAGADAMILDVGLPGLDGFDVVRALRREKREVPVILLTARVDEIDRVVGFEVGADDYVCKPFSPHEVVARVKAILRRTLHFAEKTEPVMRFERLEIDLAAREVRVDGADVRLKPREFALLLELAQNPGIALSRERLLQRVWGHDFIGDARTVDVHVHRLRDKIEQGCNLRPFLVTIHGYGYKFAHA